jgi:hypothetical protein
MTLDDGAAIHQEDGEGDGLAGLVVGGPIEDDSALLDAIGEPSG